MVIDRKGMALFAATALSVSTRTCDAFSLGRKAMMVQKGAVEQRSFQMPLHAFASDKGERRSQYDHFSISDDPNSPSTFVQESSPMAPPPMARPTENSKLARVGANSAENAAPPNDTEGQIEPSQPKLSVWERNKAAEVQGGSLRTWSFAHQHKIDMIQVHMKTDGRPMNANVELWQGPDNIPQKVAVYCEDGRARPFRAFIATPYVGNSISIRNTNTLEYPLQAVLEGGKVGMDDPETKEKMERVQMAAPKICQGGAVITERFEPDVQSVQLFLQSEGRPLNARIELIQGPNNVKQVMEVYSEEGTVRPFYSIIETPGYGTGVIRVVNTSTMEFPFSVTVQPWDFGLPDDDFDEATGGSPFFEVSGGPEGRGIGNNLRSVGSETASMGGMFGSFAIKGASPQNPSPPATSQEGGLAGFFAPSPAPAPVPAVERKMIAPKKPLPAPTKDPETSPIFLENEDFAVSSSKSSLSQDAITVPVTKSVRKASPKTSTAPPEPELEEDIEDEMEDEVDDEPVAVEEKEDPVPTQAPTGKVTKRYVPPPAPAPPKRNSHVFLDIDDAYK